MNVLDDNFTIPERFRKSFREFLKKNLPERVGRHSDGSPFGFFLLLHSRIDHLFLGNDNLFDAGFLIKNIYKIHTFSSSSHYAVFCAI